MNIEELNITGLNRHLKITHLSSELAEKLENRLIEIQKTAHVKGFRVGKVPIQHLKSIYGKNITAEIIDKEVKETIQSTTEQRNEIPAKQPQIIFPEDEQIANDIVNLKQDLVYEVKYEIIPQLEIEGLDTLSIEKLIVNIQKTEIEESIKDIAEKHKSYTPKKTNAQKGDEVTMDFVGYIGEKAFEGGTANGAKLEIGSGMYIPGFEEQLIGKKQGENCQVHVTFPDDYGQKSLAGKEARFDVNIIEVGKPAKTEIDDKLAESLGLENLNKLKEAIEEQLKREHGRLADTVVKRYVLDALDSKYQFDLPESLYNDELLAIKNEMQRQNNKSDADDKEQETPKDISIEDIEKNYGDLAKRRVRLGIVLSQIARKANISVSDKELQDEVRRQASQYPGQEQQFVELIQKNPTIQGQISAPILEQKTVDYIVEVANITEKSVTVAELQEIYKTITAEDELEPEKLTKKAKTPSKNKEKKAKK